MFWKWVPQLHEFSWKATPNNWRSLILSVIGMVAAGGGLVLPLISNSHVLIRFNLMRFILAQSLSGKFGPIGMLQVISACYYFHDKLLAK